MNKKYNDYNNQIGLLPFLPSVVSLAPKLPVIGDAVSSVSNFFSGLFGGGGEVNHGYCEYAGNTTCFNDGGSWLNDSGDLDPLFLPGGAKFTSDYQNAWGGVLLQVFRAANRNYFDDRVRQAVNAILSDRTNINGKKNFDVLASAGSEAKQKFYNYITKFAPEFLDRFYQFITNGQRPQQQQPQQQQPQSGGIVPSGGNGYTQIMQTEKSNTLLYVGIGAAALLATFLIIKKK